VKPGNDAARLAARAPLRTIRTRDLAEVYAHPNSEVRALERRGVLHRLTHGFYCAVPAEADPATWRPTLEAAAAGVASAIFGDRVPVLSHLSAARVHSALPRAIGTGYVAVPSARRPAALTDREATVRFVLRDVGRLDAILVPTDLGPTLATTPEQTVLDLSKADPRGVDLDARQAVEALLPRCDGPTLERIATEQRMRATLARVRGERTSWLHPAVTIDRLHRHPGDGWVTCGDHRHWGLFGAAGLFLVRRGPDGRPTDVVLQHRAPWSDQGGTWGVPGGALDPDETAVEGALREAGEEAGIEPAAVRVLTTHVLDHGPWSYTTVVAEVAAGARVEPAATDPESLDVRWVPVDEAPTLPLLGAFRSAWPALIELAAGD
jgi:septum formation protein